MELKSVNSNTPSPSAAARGGEKCCALVADCDCYRCQAAKGEPSLLDQMTEARNELLRDIQQNLLPQIKAQAAELSRIRTLLDREKLAEQIWNERNPPSHPAHIPFSNLPATIDWKDQCYALADKLKAYLLGNSTAEDESQTV